MAVKVFFIGDGNSEINFLNKLVILHINLKNKERLSKA